MKTEERKNAKLQQKLDEIDAMELKAKSFSANLEAKGLGPFAQNLEPLG